MQFSFGGDSGMTYEEMLQARKFAETARGTFQRPQNVGEGWGSIFANVGAGLVGRAADKAEERGKEEASSVFAELFGQRLGGGVSMSSMGQPAPQGSGGAVSGSDIPANPEISGSFGERFGSVEQQYGLPSGYLSRTAQIESNGNPNARNPNSSASGLFQFIDSTAEQYGVNHRDGDPTDDIDGAARLGRDNMQTLSRALGRAPSAGELYLAHQQGGGGAVKLLSNPNARAVDVVGAEAVRLNGGDPNMSAGEFATIWTSKIDGGGYSGGGIGSGGAGAGMDPRIVEAMANPYMSETQRSALGMLLQQQMAASAPPDPMQALQMERAQLEIEQMRNPQADPVNGVEFGGDLVNPRTGEVILDGPDPETEAPMVKTVTRSDGSEVAVQWNGRTQTWDPINAPAGGGSLTDRLDLTESEGRVTLFKSLQDETSPVLLDYEERWDPSNVPDAVARRTPVAGNFFQSPEGQQYGALASQWAEGALRLATGAAATPEEMERTMTTYFARPGDTPETIQFKAQMRESYTRSLRRAQGETQVDGRILTPAEFAAQQGGGRPPGGATGQPEPAPVEPSAWNGPSADEVRRMDQMTVRSMMNAYERNPDLIPDDVLEAIIEMGGE